MPICSLIIDSSELLAFTCVSGAHLLEEVVELLDGVEGDVLDEFLREHVHLTRHAQDLGEDFGQLFVVAGHLEATLESGERR